MDELALLRTVALKGRVGPDQIAETLGEEFAAVEASIEAGVQAETLVLTPQGLVRTTPIGRERLGEQLDAERSALDTEQVRAIYEEFSAVNAAAKAVFTDWQVRSDNGDPNDHSDADYDAAVLSRLGEIHMAVVPIVERLAAHAERARRYVARLVTAKERYEAGDHTFVTRPIIDSYHTVWFEMHEDLISWAGLTRVEEAAAGRAT